MRDGHVVIVHHDGVLVGGRAVTAQDDHVVQLGVRHAHGALHAILHHRLALPRRAQADDERAFAIRAVPPGAVEPLRPPFSLGAVPGGRDLLRWRPAAKGVPAVEHGVSDLGMAGGPRRLVDLGCVPIQAEPIQTVQDRILERIGRPRAVGVLHPQQELAAVVAGEQIVEERRAGPADVQQAGGRRGEAGPDGHGDGP